MGWPYEFIALEGEQKHLRRLTLDRYGRYVQLSALVPVGLFLLYRAALWAGTAATSRNGSYNAVPSSPQRKVQRRSAWSALQIQVDKLKWWLGEDVYLFGQLSGQRDVWIFGTAWTAWMLFLCVAETGHDYLHLTKRLGIVAVSQYPLQYILALKCLNPFVPVFRSSHEAVNRWHRPLGGIIFGLLCLHAALYLNYFIGVGILAKRLVHPAVFVGVLAFVAMTLLTATAVRTVRRLSYRLFFVTHLLSILAMPPLLFFHAHSARPAMAVALAAFLLDLAARRLGTVTAQAAVERVAGTNLVKISAPLPHHRLHHFTARPGSHVYLSVAAASLLFNPFTVAFVDDETATLTLVARHTGGPLTTALARFAAPKRSGSGSDSNSNSNSNSEQALVPLRIAGPYGAARHFPTLASSSSGGRGGYDRVLLIAGGIGATFTLPLYRAILHDNPDARVEMVWAVRGAGDAAWAMSAGGKKSLLEDEKVHIFLTGEEGDGDGDGGDSPGRSDGDDAGGVEMTALYRDRRRATTSHPNRKRPDLGKVVDEAFRHGVEDRVAVVVCGPEAMGREVRAHVGAWVYQGRKVFWHNEGFGW